MCYFVSLTIVYISSYQPYGYRTQDSGSGSDLSQQRRLRRAQPGRGCWEPALSPEPGTRADGDTDSRQCTGHSAGQRRG